MDLDAVITFESVLKKDNISTADKMLLSSAINNRNIDINLSIKQNLNLINKDGISITELFLYLKEFVADKSSYVDVPIYMLFLEKRELWDLLVNAYKKFSLKEEAVLDISKAIFKYLENSDILNEEELLTFFNSLLSVRKPEDYKMFQNIFSIEPFIYENIDEIYNGSNGIRKSLFITIISFGYVNLQLLNDMVDDSYSYIEFFIKELLNHDLYAYVKIFINSRTITPDLAVVIKNILDEYKIKGEGNYRLKHLINTINDKLDSIIDDKKFISRH